MRDGATQSAKDRGVAARNGWHGRRRRALLGLAPRELEDEEEREEKPETARERDKIELERRRGAIADAWHHSPAARRRYGVGACTVKNREEQ